ncbi:hypothetical protein HO133_006712 [Letharia lupina]|uniref:Uncharacterized protein n=1 Tax=Letharia lupina TaxID=560253 RepID=A0A8H6F6P4_9LECA|nr:uncharacterized protein HO133_006712 [Letharia lupina]KAF6217610.1 hypothetical protein HO133_006712 [Letharia lupina]
MTDQELSCMYLRNRMNLARGDRSCFGGPHLYDYTLKDAALDANVTFVIFTFAE